MIFNKCIYTYLQIVIYLNKIKVKNVLWVIMINDSSQK